MPFTSFLKSTVMACAGSATLLAVLALAGASSANDSMVIPIAAVWWTIAAFTGVLIGRRTDASTAIARLLSEAPTAPSLPEVQPARMLFNRLWPLLLATVGAGACVLVAPQIPAMAAGFPIIWSLAWRKQEKAVQAIEERDGVRFLLDKTKAWKPIQLVRTPWFRSG